MITTIAWILLVIVLIIFAFALFLFLWHPAKKEPEVIPDTSIPVYRHARKEAGEDYSWKTERYLEEAQLRWPQLPLMLERIQLDHTLLMHWNGLSKSRHDLLFSFTDRSSAEALFEAVEQISEADEIPEADFWIMIPLSDEEAVSETEVYEYFNTNHIQLDAYASKNKPAKTILLSFCKRKNIHLQIEPPAYLDDRDSIWKKGEYA